mmetsp:Transcript_20118/g.41912  ORF Transcript_20118/g.41912 Transcript_20118/m.41912 type:complete len:226 (-) Transcript_20118:20-697(-)
MAHFRRGLARRAVFGEELLENENALHTPSHRLLVLLALLAEEALVVQTGDVVIGDDQNCVIIEPLPYLPAEEIPVQMRLGKPLPLEESHAVIAVCADNLPLNVGLGIEGAPLLAAEVPAPAREHGRASMDEACGDSLQRPLFPIIPRAEILVYSRFRSVGILQLRLRPQKLHDLFQGSSLLWSVSRRRIHLERRTIEYSLFSNSLIGKRRARLVCHLIGLLLGVR